jgi:hypothetical protein
MAQLTKQIIGPTGVGPTYVAANAGGDTVAPSDTTFLHVKNASGAPITVTVDDVGSVSPSGAQAFNPDYSVSVPAAGERMIGPIGPGRFANASDGLAHISYSGVTSLTIGAFQI